jgi:hypothetical protein
VDSISGMMMAATSIQAVRTLDIDLVDEVSEGMVGSVPLAVTWKFRFDWRNRDGSDGRLLYPFHGLNMQEDK